MRLVKTLAAAAGLALVSGTAAFAWGDMYMGDGTHDPNGMTVFPYKGANNCPSGLQPVMVGGVICCGTPNTNRQYIDRAGGRKKMKVVRKARRHSPVRVYAPEGVKGVVMK